MTTNPCGLRPLEAPKLAFAATMPHGTAAMTIEATKSGHAATVDRNAAAAIDVAHLVKVYKTNCAVDDISFKIARGSITGPPGRQRRRQDHHHCHDHGADAADLGKVSVLGCAMPAQSAEVLGRMNFESPYVDMPMRLTVRQNLTVFGKLYAVPDLKGRIAQLAEDLDLTDFLDRANGKLSAGQKTRVALAKALINAPSCCCSMSRPPRSIRIPPTGSGGISRPIARATTPRSSWRRTTCWRSSGFATASSS